LKPHPGAFHDTGHDEILSQAPSSDEAEVTKNPLKPDHRAFLELRRIIMSHAPIATVLPEISQEIAEKPSPPHLHRLITKSINVVDIQPAGEADNRTSCSAETAFSR